MRKFFRVIIILIVLWILYRSIIHVSPSNEAKKIANQVIKCINDKDAEGLKNLFSKNVIQSYDLDKDIEYLFEIFEGKIISYDDFTSGSGSEITNYGKQTFLTIEPWINNVETDVGKVYEIGFFVYVINDEKPEMVGISGLKVIAENGSEYLVGKP